jgi:osmotically-inducible protein OsmY
MAALLLVLAYGLAAPAYAGEDGKDVRHSDIWLKATLITTYTLNEHLNPLDIDVDVEQGVATLTGTVDSAIERDLAGELADGVDGIKQVRNELEVRPAQAGAEEADYGFRQRVADANTTARVKSRLLWNAETQGLQIDVDTRDGVVSLEGRVASVAEADLAALIAQNTSGVRGVKAKLEVDPDDENLQLQAKESASELAGEINDAWITTKVKASLLYTKGIDGSAISVSTRDHIVHLSGTQQSLAAIERAVSTARGIVGVEQVRSDLTLRVAEGAEGTED